MATETLDARAEHIRGVTVTALAALAGVGAAIASSALTAGAENPAGEAIALYVLGAFIVGQFPVLRAAGIDIEEFSAKDYLYVAFMTFSLWFVTWGILLTSGTTIAF